MSKDLNSYVPPKDLQSMQIWTLVIVGKRQEKVSEYNYTKKRMPLLSWPAVLNRYNKNAGSYAPVTGIVSRDILVIDVDVKQTQPEELQSIIKKELPQALKNLVTAHPTLYHKSKSGNGWKVYYRTDTPIPKNMTPFKCTEKRFDGVSLGEVFQGMFVSTTDPDLSDFSGATVAEIKREDLAKFIPEVMKELQARKIQPNQQTVQNEYLDMEKLLKETKRLLSVIPVDPDPMLEVAYETRLIDLECSSYHHWLLVSHALADLALKLSVEYSTAYDKLLEMFVTWSTTGQSFESDADCIERFERSYNETIEATSLNKTRVTFQTLRRLFWGYRVPIDDFPVIVVSQKHGGKAVDPTDPSNYEFLTDLLKIKLQQDFSLGDMYIQGPVAIIKHYFSDLQPHYLTDNDPKLSLPFLPRYRNDSNLTYRLIKLFRHFGIKGAMRTHPVLAGLDKTGVEVADTLFTWMSAKPWDKRPRVLDLISQSVFIEESLIPYGLPDDFYFQLIFKHLIHMAGLRAKAYRAVTHQPKYLDRFKKAQGILILAGHQNAKKSTWIECLLPAQVPFVVNVTPSSVKDTLEIQRALAGAFIFNIDEVDAVFDKLDLSDFKNVITQESDMFRTMYTQKVEKNPRAAGLFGTTNKMHLKLDRTGNRRFWIIPVKCCDARPLVNCDYQQFWAELLFYAENLGLEEWNIDEDEKRYINKTAMQYSKQTLSGRTIDMAFTDENGEFLLYDHTEVNFDTLFDNLGQAQQRHFCKAGLLFAKRGNKAFVSLQNKFLMDDNIDFKMGPFEHELEDLVSNLTDMANETRAYKNMVFANGVVQFYARGRNNPPLLYHFIPYKDVIDRLVANGKISKEIFI